MVNGERLERVTASVGLLDWPGSRVPTGLNVFVGQVVSIRHGLTRTSVQVKVDRHVIVRSRRPARGQAWPLALVGEWVRVRIPPEAVLVETMDLWPGRPRWNRWRGRIVLVGPTTEGSHVTVKLKGTSLSLFSVNRIAGLQHRPDVGTGVTMAVDPERVELRWAEEAEGFDISPIQARMPLCPLDYHRNERVWLKGVVQSVRRQSEACVVELLIGDARVAAQVDVHSGLEWMEQPGRAIELHMSQWEAWIKPAGSDGEAVPCRLTY